MSAALPLVLRSVPKYTSNMLVAISVYIYILFEKTKEDFNE